MTTSKIFRNAGRLALIVGVLLALTPRASFAQEAQTNKAQGDLQVFSKLSSGLAELLNAPQKNTKTDDSEANEDAPKERSDAQTVLPVPRSAGVVLKTPSLRRLDAGATVFFKRTSDDEFSALSALRLTSLSPALEQIDVDAPAAITLFCESAPPKAALVLPVARENFTQFVVALNETVSESERRSPQIDQDGKSAKTLVALEEPFEAAIRQIDPNYVAIVSAEDAKTLDQFNSDSLREGTEEELPPGLNDAFLTLELSSRGAFYLTLPNRPLWREFENLTARLQSFAPEYPIKENLSELREELRLNLGCARVDLAVDDAQIYLSTQKAPKSGSAAAKRVASYPQLSSFDPTVDRYFVVLPYRRGAVCGQTEIAPTTAATLEAPYNRLRYVEYSLALPLQNELAAESWIFFLEVDDAKEFVKEAIIPNAREIGRYVGARQAEEIGADLFGAIAARRQERQLSRRRQPARIVDPNESAARGAALGALLGAAIGESSGEKTAMKEYPIDGFTAYISDLETYARQKALMRAEKEGRPTPRPSGVFIDQERPLLSAIGGLLQNVDGGEDGLQRAIMNSANARAELVDNSPLLARTGFWVVLDDRRLLFGLGNTDMLRSAINNWQALSKPNIRYLSFDSDASAIDSLKGLCAKTPNLQEVQAVGTIRLDLAASQEYYCWFMKNYLPNEPQPQFRRLPSQGSDLLIASSLVGGAEKIDVVTPFQTVKNAFNAFADGASPLQLLVTPKTSEQSDDKEDEEFDVDFDEK